MTNAVRIGTATAKPYSIVYGRWDAYDFPTGTKEFLPVIVAQGKPDGPCLWLTAGIHGPEHAGPAVIYRLITKELVEQLHGTIVAIPALCPSGLRTTAYVPYNAPVNPNRLWPDGKPKKQDPDKAPPSPIEKAFARLFDEIRASADYLIDYHNAQTGSISFVFRDRVLYRNGEDANRNRTQAESLSAKLGDMIAAYGHTVVNEYPAHKYIDEDLHRSTSGATLQLAKIPAFTAELGTGHMPDPKIVASAIAGTRNVLRWAGMLEGNAEPINLIPVVDLGHPIRRRQTPRVSEACVALHTVEAGDIVKAGDPVAELRDIWGRPIGEGVVRAEQDGVVLGRTHGIYYSPGQAVLSMAVHDEDDLVGPYPDGYFNGDRE